MEMLQLRGLVLSPCLKLSASVSHVLAFCLLQFDEMKITHFGVLSLQLAHLTEMEVKHRCNQVLELGFPLGGLAKLFAQDWEGDVTVIILATLAQVHVK